MTAQWNVFDNPEAVASALADFVSRQLQNAIQQHGQAFMAVSGGTTPVTFFEKLSQHNIDWDKVCVTLVDERCVDETSPRSNTALIRQHLLQNQAKAARFFPLYTPAPSLDAAAQLADHTIRALARPFDVVVLGMGLDGHVASLFPDAPEIDSLLSQKDGAQVIATGSANAGEPRLSLSFPTIIAADTIILHIEGAAKADVLKAALQPDAARLPVRAVIEKAQQPIQIYWAPTKG